jgi:hypothetical protein
MSQVHHVSLAIDTLPNEFLSNDELGLDRNEQRNNAETVRILLTPRSTLACEMQGIMPEEVCHAKI